MATTGVSGEGRAAGTRRRILAAARTAFAAKGYDGTNLVGDVLEPAKVSAGSFYHQFPSKAELYAAVIEEVASSWGMPWQVLASAEEPLDVTSVTRRVYEGLLTFLDEKEDLVRIQMRDRDHPDPEVSSPLRGLRQAWIDALALTYRGIVSDPAAAAELTVALGIGAIAIYLETPTVRRPTVRARMVENLSVFTVGGLRALSDPGR